MKRHLLNFFTLVSLSLCIATIAWVVVGYRRNFSWSFRYATRSVTLASGERVTAAATYVLQTHNREVSLQGIDPTFMLTLDRMSYGLDPAITLYLLFPLRRVLLLTPFFAIAPGLKLLAMRRNARLRTSGCCAKCGYDLRASPERCPECGNVRSKTATA